MLIIEGRGPMPGYKPDTTRVEVDANTRQGVIEFSVAEDATGKLTPSMKDLSGHPFVRADDNGHQYIRILSKSLVTFRLPVGANYTFGKVEFFTLVKPGTSRFYALEFDENADEVREFTLHAHSTYVDTTHATDAHVHSFNIRVDSHNFAGRAVADVDPDIKNPPPVGQ